MCLWICTNILYFYLFLGKEKLDYVEEYQNLATASESMGLEIFLIPNMGYFAVMANKNNQPGSALYRWSNGKFIIHQYFSTYQAQAWKHFTIEKRVSINVIMYPTNYLGLYTNWWRIIDNYNTLVHYMLTCKLLVKSWYHFNLIPDFLLTKQALWWQLYCHYAPNQLLGLIYLLACVIGRPFGLLLFISLCNL